ncbi:hypothetical protein PM082_002415 [Marasmius tenuissimus]|nr:hypothetical protein PM082_002415 [Marasmius tenuissimus]
MEYATRSLLLILGLSVAVRVVKALSHHLHIRRCLRTIPGPRPSSLLWGEEWLLYHTEPGSQYSKWHEEFGRVVKFTGAIGHQALSITDTRAITSILGEHAYSFPKPDGVRAWFKATLGEGLVWTEGKENHQRQRRMLAPGLSKQSVRNMMPIFYGTASKLASHWSKLIENSDRGDEAEIEATSWAGRFALDSVTQAAFSYDCGFLSGDHESLLASLDGLTNNENKASSFYMRALFWIFPSILSIGQKGEMIRRSKRELGAIASKVWRDAKIAGDTEGKNLMAMMLKVTLEPGDRFSEEEAVAQMRTVISAGYETTSGLIAWVLYELAMSSDVQARLREEILTAGDVDLSMDRLNELSFLDAVIKETLRMHPPISENHHQAAETISVPLSEPLPNSSETHLVIPKGTTIAIPVNVVHSDPSVFGDDADVFRPDRWSERQKKGIRNEREIFAFSEGPRTCIGKMFALTEIKVLLVTLFRQFSVSCSRDIEPFQSFVVRPRVKGEARSSLPLVVRKV